MIRAKSSCTAHRFAKSERSTGSALPPGLSGSGADDTSSSACTMLASFWRVRKYRWARLRRFPARSKGCQMCEEDKPLPSLEKGCHSPAFLQSLNDRRKMMRTQCFLCRAGAARRATYSGKREEARWTNTTTKTADPQEQAGAEPRETGEGEAGGYPCELGVRRG